LGWGGWKVGEGCGWSERERSEREKVREKLDMGGGRGRRKKSRCEVEEWMKDAVGYGM